MCVISCSGSLGSLGQPSTFLVRSPAVCLAGLGPCGLLLSALSVSSASPGACLLPWTPIGLAAETGSCTDGRERNLEVDVYGVECRLV